MTGFGLKTLFYPTSH